MRRETLTRFKVSAQYLWMDIRRHVVVEMEEDLMDNDYGVRKPHTSLCNSQTIFP